MTRSKNWSDIAPNKGIELKQYNSPDVPALARAIMRSVSQSILHDYCIDILWNCAHVFNKSCPNWSGYMSSLKTNNHLLAKSVITMLPVINLHATKQQHYIHFCHLLLIKVAKLMYPLHQ